MPRAPWGSGLLLGLALSLTALIAHMSLSSSLRSPARGGFIPRRTQRSSPVFAVSSQERTVLGPHPVWETYVSTYNRDPPPGFDKWIQFATDRRCRLDHAAYREIEEDLAMHRRNRPTPATVRAGFEKLDSVSLISVRNGYVTEVKSRGPIEFGDYYAGKIGTFAAYLPDMDIIANSLDEPRVWWPEPLPQALQTQLDKGMINTTHAFKQHGCQRTAALSRWHNLHSFVVAPHPNRSIVHELVPIMSFSSIPGCFADIRVPNRYSMVHHGQCAPDGAANAIPWEEKLPVVYWRGSNTGTLNDPKEVPRELAVKLHRNRLVSWARAHDSILNNETNAPLYDIGYTELVQGDGTIALELNGGKLFPYVPSDQAYRHKYLLVIDGNAAATRLPPFLCSSSLVFLIEGMVEWFYSRIEPWVHYVPVLLDLSDLEEKVAWARLHDDEAQAIVKRANHFMAEETRQEDHDCFWYRFLLEYGALMEGDQPDVTASAGEGQRTSHG